MAHSVATPALLCQKDTAQGTQSPLLGAILDFRWSTYIVVQSVGVFVDYRSSDDGDGDSGSAGSAV